MVATQAPPHFFISFFFEFFYGVSGAVLWFGAFVLCQWLVAVLVVVARSTYLV